MDAPKINKKYNISMAQKIELWNLERLKPYDNNAREHSPEQVAQIAASITEFGFLNPILVDSNDGIVAGHGRLSAARELALDVVPVVVLDHLTEAQKKAYILVDNKLAENASWNEELLQEEIVALNLQDFDISILGWDEDEIREIMEYDSAFGEGEGEGESRGLGGEPVIQYNIIFDNEQQQQIWFDFLKDLRQSQPDDTTIAEKIINFIEEKNG
ncbi:MAG: ParB/Srx family N-terminal domain-containing protein [Pseudomonadota bacterium]|nr:ParB/Srx family N-terminal domain-containing protein [Pseudomonadota bacterium]